MASSCVICALKKVASEHVLRLFKPNVQISVLLVSDGEGRVYERLLEMVTMIIRLEVFVLSHWEKIGICGFQT